MNEISTPKEMPITTQFCTKATGIRHEYVVRAFNQLLAKSLKNKNTQIEYSYESYTYDSALISDSAKLRCPIITHRRAKSYQCSIYRLRQR